MRRYSFRTSKIISLVRINKRGEIYQDQPIVYRSGHDFQLNENCFSVALYSDTHVSRHGRFPETSRYTDFIDKIHKWVKGTELLCSVEKIQLQAGSKDMLRSKRIGKKTERLIG